MYVADGQADRRAVRGAERRKTDRQPRIAVTLGAPSASCAAALSVPCLPYPTITLAGQAGGMDGWLPER